MRMQETSREELGRRIREGTGLIVAAMLGAGVALCLSIFFLPAGLLLIGAAAPVALAGWTASRVAPRLIGYTREEISPAGVTSVDHPR